MPQPAREEAPPQRRCLASAEAAISRRHDATRSMGRLDVGERAISLESLRSNSTSNFERQSVNKRGQLLAENGDTINTP